MRRGHKGKINLKHSSKTVLTLKRSHWIAVGGLVLAFVFLYTTLDPSVITSGSSHTISGTVYLDYDNDGQQDNLDLAHPALKVNVYEDVNGNNLLDASDLVVGSDITTYDGRYEITVTSGSNSLTREVATQNDDAEENASSGSMYLTSSDLEFVYDGSTKQIIGVRFADISIPASATINSAAISFKIKSSNSSSYTFNIYGDQDGDSQTFSSTKNDISSRKLTNATASWVTNSWKKNKYVSTPDLSSIISEIIALPDWKSGNGLTFIFTGSSGTKRVYSYGSTPPSLTINYTTAPATKYIVAIDSSELDASSTIRAVAMDAGTASDVNVSYTGAPALCYALSDEGSSNQLVYVNRFSGTHILAKDGGYSGAANTETMSFSPGGAPLYAIDANRLGTINQLDGTFVGKSNVLGTGDGADGPINFTDADGMAFDPISGDLWASHRYNSKKDVLFKVDTTTGQFIPDAFGSGIDYVVISGSAVQNDIDDLAVDPNDGKLYAINNGSGSTEYIVEIDKTNGEILSYTPISLNGGDLTDVEGFGFTNIGQLFGTTGTSGGSTANSLYELNLSTGVATLITQFSVGSDYEGCDCLTSAPNEVTGKVFVDSDSDGTPDGFEEVVENVKIMVYLDVNDNGKIDSLDTWVDSVFTDVEGDFTWGTGSNQRFLFAIDTLSIPSGLSMKGDNLEEANFSFGIGGESDKGNYFTLRDFNTILGVAWGNVEVHMKEQDAVLTWTTLNETDMDFFVVERSTDLNIFEELDMVPSNGNSTSSQLYGYTDLAVTELQKTRLYYRIKEIGLNGEATYSPTVEIAPGQGAEHISLSAFPNPADNFVNISCHSNTNEPLDMIVFDASGRQMIRKTLDHNQLNHPLKLDISNWKQGMYFIKISGKLDNKTYRFVVI